MYIYTEGIDRITDIYIYRMAGKLGGEVKLPIWCFGEWVAK